MKPVGDVPAATVIEAIEQQARRHGRLPALIDRDRTVTFDAMNRAANRLAHTLRDTLGPSHGFVAVCLPPGAEQIIAVLGILKAGHGYAVIDPRLHDRGRHDLVRQCGALCVVTDPAGAAGWDADLRRLDIAASWQPGPDDDPGPHPAPDAVAYLRYTSGSTGQPKGVLHNHRAAMGQGVAFVETVQLRAGDRICSVTFFAHAVVLGSLMAGATLHIVDITREGLRAVAGRLRRERVSVLECFPSVLRSLTVVLPPGHRLADLRLVTLSGEPVTSADINLALRLMPEGGVATNNYGSSEFVQIASHAIRAAVREAEAVPVGRPPSGVELRLLDARGTRVADGQTGEVAVRAPFMSSGYWQRPDLTREVFGSATPQDGQSFYRTGDIGRIGPDGLLTVLGRVDNQIKLRAHRITPEEIEAVLLTHPSVGAAAVRLVSDAPGPPFLAAYIVPAPDAAVEPAVLRGFAQTHLPSHMVPSAFHALAALPQTVGGKLDRAALATLVPNLVELDGCKLGKAGTLPSRCEGPAKVQGRGP